MIGVARRVLVCDKITMDVLRDCMSIREAAEFTGMSAYAVRHQAVSKGVGGGKVVFRFPDDYDKMETFCGKSSRPVAISQDGGKTYHCMYSVHDAARVTGMSCSSITKAIKGSQMLDGAIVRYAR